MLTSKQAETLRAHAFRPGQSGNVKGRPRGVRRVVRERTRDAAEATDYLLGVVCNPEASYREREEATRLLLLWGWGVR